MMPIAARPTSGSAPEASVAHHKARGASDESSGGFAEVLGAATASAAREESDRGGVAVDTAAASTQESDDLAQPDAVSIVADPAVAPSAPPIDWAAWLHWTSVRGHEDVPDSGCASPEADMDVAAPTPVELTGTAAAVAPPQAGTLLPEAAAEAAEAQTPESVVPASGAPHGAGQVVLTTTPTAATSAPATHVEPPPAVAPTPDTQTSNEAPADTPVSSIPTTASAAPAASATRHAEHADPARASAVSPAQDFDAALNGAGTGPQPVSSVQAAVPADASVHARVEPAGVARGESGTPPVLHTPVTAQPPPSAQASDGVEAPQLPTQSAETAAAVVDQVVRSLRMQWTQGIGEARIQLRPEHLGPVDVSIKVEGGAVTAVVRAESSQVQEWILGHQQSLRQQLEDAGLRLADLVISPDADRRHKRDDAREHQTRRPLRRRLEGEAEPIFEVVV